MREGIGSSDIDARPMAERPAMSREPLRSVSFMMRTVADDCFEVLCRDDNFKELACEGLLQLTFFFLDLSNVAHGSTCTTEQTDRKLLPKFHSNGILMPGGLKAANVIAAECGKFIDPSEHQPHAAETRTCRPSSSS
jgi:hypothetical protein